MHVAPGEAEAECALLQREGIVDAVLSEDVDTLMFGSGMTMRSWTPEMKSSKVPTHVNVYDAATTKQGSGLDRDGMILIALMSGGDYIPEGIPGCGPKTACEAARAGFGSDLCKIKKSDDTGFAEWRRRLQHELHTNESKLFRQKHKTLNIPDDFPNREVLGYYTHPCISSPEKLSKLRATIKWDAPLDFPSLRSFAADAFDWRCIGGAKKFVRNLAPALLVRELRLRAEEGKQDNQAVGLQEKDEGRLVSAIHGKRTHATTDNMVELRISFVPLNLVDIDLSIEEPDEELSTQGEDSESEAPALDLDEDGCPTSPKKVRGPSTYDPTVVEKIWVMGTWLKLGTPLKVQDWEASFRDAKQFLAAKHAAKELDKAARAKKKSNKAAAGMQRGALDRFTKITKPGVDASQARAKSATLEDHDLFRLHNYAQKRFQLPSSQPLPNADKSFGKHFAVEEVDLSTAVDQELPKRQAKRRSSELASPSNIFKAYRAFTKVKEPTVISLLSSPELTPRANRAAVPAQCNEDPFSITDILPDTITKRRKKSPSKRHHTAPTLREDSGFPTPNSSRALTPPLLDTIEAIDLAFPVSRSALLATPSKANIGLENQIIDLDTTPRAMRAAEIISPSAKPCRDIDEWIRRSQSVTPAKARHANFLQPREGNAAPSQDAVYDPEVALDEAEEVELPGVSAFLPAMRRYRERISPVKSSDTATSNSPANISNKPIVSMGQTQTRRSPRIEHACVVSRSAASSRPKTVATKVTKRHIKLRESLDGAWKEVEAEQVNLTGEQLPTATKKIQSTTRWRKSEVEVLDLTGS